MYQNESENSLLKNKQRTNYLQSLQCQWHWQGHQTSKRTGKLMLNGTGWTSSCCSRLISSPALVTKNDPPCFYDDIFSFAQPGMYPWLNLPFPRLPPSSDVISKMNNSSRTYYVFVQKPPRMALPIKTVPIKTDFSLHHVHGTMTMVKDTDR